MAEPDPADMFCTDYMFFIPVDLQRVDRVESQPGKGRVGRSNPETIYEKELRS